MKRMNYIKILCFSAVITGLGSIVSCGDAKYDTLDTHAYIEEALSSTSQKVTVQATGESFTTYNPQIQISAESETKRSIFREKDKTKRSKKESAQHSKSRNKSFVMTSVSAL